MAAMPALPELGVLLPAAPDGAVLPCMLVGVVGAGRVVPPAAGVVAAPAAAGCVAAAIVPADAPLGAAAVAGVSVAPAKGLSAPPPHASDTLASQSRAACLLRSAQVFRHALTIDIPRASDMCIVSGTSLEAAIQRMKSACWVANAQAVNLTICYLLG
jgi:hypothetical protein